MPEIKLEHINKRWGKFYAVDDLSMTIRDNAFVTLLGPSGCGKTTTLRMIAGLETPTSGKITIGDKVVFDSARGINIPANKRKVGFLFQNYALWPNMTVYQNISFGLTNIKEEMPKIDFEARTNSQILRILKNSEELVKVLEECRDKNGKIDNKRAILKLIDTFTISQYTAKTLFSYHIEEGKDVSEEIRKLEARVKESVEKNHLDSSFQFTENGKVVVENRKMSREEIDLAVRRVSRIVKIGMFMDRYPAELSGGQQQRVAIARTLAPEPSVLFMDEPLSNLDAKLRLEMRYELQRLHVETGSTFVYVTHDQMEAMTLASEICLINNGVLQQYQPPLEVYKRPSNLFVADFVGNPSINFVDGKGEEKKDGSIELEVLDGEKVKFIPSSPLSLKAWREDRGKEEEKKKLDIAKRSKEKDYVEKGNKDEVFKYHIQKVIEEDDSISGEPVVTDQDFVLGIRPECIKISADGKLQGEIYGAMPTGMESTIKVRVGDFLLTGVVFGDLSFRIGATINLSVESDRIMLFDRMSGKLITTGSLEIL